MTTLYKKTAKGAIERWDISVVHEEGEVLIKTSWGQVKGKSQESKERVSSGKNIGRTNETSIQEQANKEATARWLKQKKKGYVISIADAKQNRTDNVIAGGVLPMLAHKYDDHANKIVYPAFVQPKLDGIRCIAILEKGSCSLWTRTRKRITSMGHIEAEIEERFKKDVILDGELYNHKFKHNFEHIVSQVRNEEPTENSTDVQYHVYDTVTTGTFLERIQELKKFPLMVYTKLVSTWEVTSEVEVMRLKNEQELKGYEGIMVRNSAGLYLNKRSYDLLKVKSFEDAEFEILGVQEGKGKLAGHVGSFICQTPEGAQFSAKLAGETALLQKYFRDSRMWEGKLLTVKYQGKTTQGIPRFPVGLRIREE